MPLSMIKGYNLCQNSLENQNDDSCSFRVCLGKREEGTNLEFNLNAQMMQRFLHHIKITNYRALTSSRKF